MMRDTVREGYTINLHLIQLSALNPTDKIRAYVVASHVKTLNASLASFVFKLSHLIGRINRISAR